MLYSCGFQIDCHLLIGILNDFLVNQEARVVWNELNEHLVAMVYENALGWANNRGLNTSSKLRFKICLKIKGALERSKQKMKLPQFDRSHINSSEWA